MKMNVHQQAGPICFQKHVSRVFSVKFGVFQKKYDPKLHAPRTKHGRFLYPGALWPGKYGPRCFFFSDDDTSKFPNDKP